MEGAREGEAATPANDECPSASLEWEGCPRAASLSTLNRSRRLEAEGDEGTLLFSSFGGGGDAGNGDMCTASMDGERSSSNTWGGGAGRTGDSGREETVLAWLTETKDTLLEMGATADGGGTGSGCAAGNSVTCGSTTELCESTTER